MPPDRHDTRALHRLRAVSPTGVAQSSLHASARSLSAAGRWMPLRDGDAAPAQADVRRCGLPVTFDCDGEVDEPQLAGPGSPPGRAADDCCDR